MKAACYREYGSSDVLRIETVSDPRPREGEILIRVRAAEVSKADCEVRSFRLPVQWYWLPLRLAMGITSPRKRILGNYFAGEVLATATDVTRFREGDRIYGCTRFQLGAHAELLCLRATRTLERIPENVSFAEAAAVPLGGLNALHFIRKAKIQPAEKVLVNGAGGSIGLFAVQLAKHAGAEVTAVDAKHKEMLLRNAGAHHFIDYRKTDFTQSGQTYDVILSMVASTCYYDCMRMLNPGGRYLMANPRFSDLVRTLLPSKFKDRTSTAAFATEQQEELAELGRLLQAGSIKAIVDRVYRLDQIRAAHERVETEQRMGTVVVAPDNLSAS
jgi:NADPH:quinone reductase-like Zn-dependent oxidoreductase